MSESTKRHNRITHGMTKTRPFRIWTMMIQRCTNPRMPCYENYGGRGIAVCQRWLDSFEAFYADMGEPPAGMTIDRINNAEGYCKSNCRWATGKQQARNSRKAHLIEFQGRSLCIAEWSEVTGITAEAIKQRVAAGWSIERALTEPHVFRPRSRRTIRSKSA